CWLSVGLRFLGSGVVGCGLLAAVSVDWTVCLSVWVAGCCVGGVGSRWYHCWQFRRWVAVTWRRG
ncbi:unnamed protein product, partial [Ilex paraguariensis]